MAVVRVAGHELFGVPVNEQFPIALHDNGDGTFSIAVYDLNGGGSGSGSGTVIAVYAGSGLVGGPITTSGSLSLPALGLTPGYYTNANLTVDGFGRVTAVANGSVASGSTSLVSNEDLSAYCDDSRVTFNLSNGFLPNTTMVYLNRLRQRIGAGHSYIEGTGLDSITFTVAPMSGNELIVDYQLSGVATVKYMLDFSYDYNSMYLGAVR